jgi:acetyl-CoA carboxylase biotin carboxyl carrier protein
METDKKITYAEMLRVLETIKATSQFEYIHLKFGDIEIELSRGPSPSVQPSNSTAPPAPVLQPLKDGPAPKPAPAKPALEAAPAARAQPDQTWPPSSILVRSPMVGTFYRKPSPDAAPFVEIGQSVEQGSTLCIVEVMKLMNSINANVRGTITHILVADAELVEPGQILMVINPQ